MAVHLQAHPADSEDIFRIDTDTESKGPTMTDPEMIQAFDHTTGQELKKENEKKKK